MLYRVYCYFRDKLIVSFEIIKNYTTGEKVVCIKDDFTQKKILKKIKISEMDIAEREGMFEDSFVAYTFNKDNIIPLAKQMTTNALNIAEKNKANAEIIISQATEKLSTIDSKNIDEILNNLEKNKK